MKESSKDWVLGTPTKEMERWQKQQKQRRGPEDCGVQKPKKKMASRRVQLRFKMNWQVDLAREVTGDSQWAASLEWWGQPTRTMGVREKGGRKIGAANTENPEGGER